jgi:putative ABC transport system substrate-binding protein
MIERRQFITLLGGAATWPVMARAQQTGRLRRLGVLFGTSASEPKSQHHATVFRQELAGLGWTEDRNLKIDFRFAVDLGPSQAAAMELVRLAPNVIYAWGGIQTTATRQQTQTIPIVFTGPSSPVADVNVARPQGNITGFPFLYPSIAGKWVELLKEADPHVSRAAVIYGGTGGIASNEYFPFVRDAALALGISLILASAQNMAELERAIDAFATEPRGGLIVLPGSVTGTRDAEDLLRKLATRHRLPVVHWDNSFPAEGGLMSYASSFEDLHRRAAGYVDRILRGARVSELPIERPTKFELIVNVKAAKAIGLAIPEAFLLRADELIE